MTLLAPTAMETRAPHDSADDDLAVYVHWPFCRAKCPYCDFNSHATASVDQERWRRALLAELAHFARETQGRRVTSLFFGGGTPSLMPPATVAAIIDAVADHWTVDEAIEITLEANPTSVEMGRFRELATAGVNRVSIGVQALDDASLQFLGRAHSAAEAREAVAAAAKIFSRYSFDLIYALPGVTPARWRRELADAVALAGDHLSLYQLTIEPGTPFFRDHVSGADPDTAASLYELTQTELAAARLPAYEISNHAAPGAACRHNVAIWQGQDYVGVGPGAHARLTADGTANALHQIATPDRWLGAVERRRHGTAKRRALTPIERAEELVLTGLRLADGVDVSTFRRRCGLELGAVVNPAATAELIEAKLVVAEPDRLRVTAEGRLLLDTIISRLLAASTPTSTPTFYG